MFVSNAQGTPQTDIYLNEVERGYLYQIALGGQVDEVLAINPNGELIVVDAKPDNNALPTGVTLTHTLWCVDIESEDQGINPVYMFLNKATGDYLSLTSEDFKSLGLDASSTTPVKVGGDIYRWKFSTSHNNAYLSKNISLYAYIENSYAIGLNVNASGDVRVVKTKVNTSGTANEVTSDAPYADDFLSRFTLQTAYTLKYLTDLQFNEVIGNQDKEDGVSLVFDEDLTINPFTGVKIFAETAANYSVFASSTYVMSNNSSFLYLSNEEGEYLMVDTAFYNNLNENRYLKYKWVDVTSLKAYKDNNYTSPVDYLDSSDEVYRGHYMFRFEYQPSYNNLLIDVAGLVYPVVTTDSKGNEIWASWPTTTTEVNQLISSQGENIVYDTEVYVYKQGYAGESRLTVASISSVVADKGQNVNIGFAGFDGCNVAADKTSLPTDLYLITDGKGRYLASPIYQTKNNNNNSNASATTRYAEWVEIDRNVDPWTMPSFQWVVQKPSLLIYCSLLLLFQLETVSTQILYLLQEVHFSCIRIKK